MDAAVNVEPQPQRTPARGAGLLIHHCVAIGGGEARLPARMRLEQALGPELAELLVGALAPGAQPPAS